MFKRPQGQTVWTQIRAVCSGSTLFASILYLSVMLGNYLQQTTPVDIFRSIFFLGALRVNASYWLVLWYCLGIELFSGYWNSVRVLIYCLGLNVFWVSSRGLMLWLLSGQPGFTCWISFAPVFRFMYCRVLIFALSSFHILIYMFTEMMHGVFHANQTSMCLDPHLS